MEYHRRQLKRSAKAAMADSRPRAWLITVLFLLICGIVSSLFGYLAPEPFEELAEPISNALTAAADYVSGTGDVKQALEEFELALGKELLDEFMDEARDVPADGNIGEALQGFAGRLLAGSVLAALASSLLSLLASLVNTVFTYGYHAYCLGVFRRQDPSAGKLFSAFPRILTVLGSHIMVAVFTFLWTLLAVSAGIVLMFLVTLVAPYQTEVSAVLFVLIYLGVLIFIAAFTLRYALTTYIVVEDRKVGVFEAIRRSKELMKGNKLRMFFLGFSFVGWNFLIVLLTGLLLTVGIVGAGLVISVSKSLAIAGIVLAVGVGLAALVALPMSLWLTTYQNVTFAGFYHIVSFRDEDKPSWEEDTLPVAVGAGVPVWANAPEEEVLPPYAEEETPAEAAAEEVRGEEVNPGEAVAPAEPEAEFPEEPSASEENSEPERSEE